MIRFLTALLFFSATLSAHEAEKTRVVLSLSADGSFVLDVANDPLFVPGFAFLGFLYLTGFYIIRRMVDLKV